MTNPGAQAMLADLPRTIKTIETAYDFECKSGALKNCGEWKYLKRIAESLRAASAPVAVRIDCRDCGEAIDTGFILSHPRSCIVCDPEFGDPRVALSTPEEASEPEEISGEEMDLIERNALALIRPAEASTEIEMVCAEAYQVVGTLLSDTGQFDTEHGNKILDNLSQDRMVHDDVLPWKSVEASTAAWEAEWQLIETAPKDGTHILAYRQPVGIRVTNMSNPPTVVHWFDDPEEPGFYTSVNERAPDYPFRPTHWKPLGPPPGLLAAPPAAQTDGVIQQRAFDLYESYVRRGQTATPEQRMEVMGVVLRAISHCSRESEAQRPSPHNEFNPEREYPGSYSDAPTSKQEK